MVGPSQPNAVRVVERLRDAINAHDHEALVACFSPDYQSQQPAHPGREFGGIEQVRKNWTTIFRMMPDFRASLLGVAYDGERVWSEWYWEGTQASGRTAAFAGVIIMRVLEDRIAAARWYLEEVEKDGAGIDSAVERMTRGKGAESSA